MRYSLPLPLGLNPREVTVTHFSCRWKADLDLGGLKVTGISEENLFFVVLAAVHMLPIQVSDLRRFLIPRRCPSLPARGPLPRRYGRGPMLRFVRSRLSPAFLLVCGPVCLGGAGGGPPHPQGGLCFCRGPWPYLLLLPASGTLLPSLPPHHP